MSRYFESVPKTWLHAFFRGWQLVLSGKKAVVANRHGVTNPTKKSDLQVVVYKGML